MSLIQGASKAVNFRNACIAVSCLFGCLSLGLLFSPEFIYWLFSLEQNDLGDFFAKRAGVLFVGLSLLCFLARNSIDLELRNTVSLVVGTTMLLMAIVGTYELARGFVRWGMLFAIFTELAMGVMFLFVWINNTGLHLITAIHLPSCALLSRYDKDSFYTDCFTTNIPIDVTHEQFVQAFYTTWLFKIERFILRYAVSKPSTDEQVAALASGELELFSAWTVEDRCSNQILLCDFQKRTRSWLMTTDTDGASDTGTTLLFGSAVVPVKNKRTGELDLGIGFKLLLGFHKLYSKALLSCAAVKLMKVYRD